MYFHYAVGDPPSDVVLVQYSLTQVIAVWTSPSAQTPVGYRVTVTVAGFLFLTQHTEVATVTFSLYNNQYGDYGVQVVSLYSDKLPSVPAVSAEITVRGKA